MSAARPEPPASPAADLVGRGGAPPPVARAPADDGAGGATVGAETAPLREDERRDSVLFEGVGRERRLRRWVIWTIQVVLLTLFLLGWEWLVEAKVADRFFFSQPSAIAKQLWDWFAGGSVYRHIGITMLETLLGFFGGTLLGLVIGFVLARSQTLGDIFEPFLALLNGMPRVVLAPLVILWLGLGIASKIALSVLVVFLIVFYAVYTGIREVDQNLVANARILGANGRQLTWHVLIPSALTWIFSSLRVSVGFALVGAVVAEYLGSNMGVGFLIANAQSFFQSTGVYAGLVVLMLMVGAINLLLRAVERRFSAWKAG
jgi:NitT/TauT family transport system permease protein